MAVIRTTFKELGNLVVSQYCKKLLKEGVNPDARLEIFRDGKEEPDLIVKSVKLGSKAGMPRIDV